MPTMDTIKPIDYDILTYNLLVSPSNSASLDVLQASTGFLLTEILHLARSSEFDAIRLKALQIILNKILPDITESRLEVSVVSPYERILKDMEQKTSLQTPQKTPLPHRQMAENNLALLSVIESQPDVLVTKSGAVRPQDADHQQDDNDHNCGRER